MMRVPTADVMSKADLKVGASTSATSALKVGLDVGACVCVDRFTERCR
jgi:hypothetical protein